MISAIQSMLERYECKNSKDYKNALKEIIQEVALCGLSRGNFFKEAAFYGETALRIFYGLDRFSEDMDFSLCAPNQNFSLSDYFSFLEEELSAAGFSLSLPGEYEILRLQSEPLLSGKVRFRGKAKIARFFRRNEGRGRSPHNLS